MGFIKNFLMNAGMMVTIAYVANIIYKYALIRFSARIKYVSSIFLLIFAGWASCFFGFRLSENVIFDLRFLPLIVAAAVYSRPIVIMLVGVGIGLTRLTFGIDMAAFVGVLNLSILGAVCAVLNIWMRNSTVKLHIKAIITVLVVNIINTFDIAVLGVVPIRIYVFEIMPFTLPMSILMSGVFVFILRDFHTERQRMLQLEHANELLYQQTEELQQTQFVLEERAKQLLLVSQYKSEFLANMSHELRTPLNSIINLAQMMADKEDQRTEEETVLYSQMIYQSGLDLLELINDVLDLSKVEAGKLEITYEEVRLWELVEVLRMHFEITAQKKGITFATVQDSHVPETIFSDAQRIQQILRNLLTNAFKFTQKGSVTMRIHKHWNSEDQSEWIVFSVQDTGIGIAPSQHQVIFEAFEQADSSITRRYGGTGLGLSISRDLATMLGGYLSMESREHEGSIFSLYLPLLRPPSVE
ncbi:sensor histidine kinase [Paenibacillus sp. KACC 21273]|uniref:sensor histidine kinase n=1 Tax=Paenibacillus sp. KACC 21273 TaxID=3025665 RepID=UPI003FCE6AED